MSRPSDNPIVQQMQVLLGGYGFNYYADANKARADDLLVRQHAGGMLLEAIKALTTLEQQYRRKYIPPSTREQPYPPADKMTSLKEIGELAGRIADLECSIRSMPVPTQDKIWWRFRDEQNLLDSLLSYDRLLIQQAALVRDTTARITADAWEQDLDSIRGSLEPAISQVKDTFAKRHEMLVVPL